MPLALALVHYPVYNKDGLVVSTSLTNLDIHDIARAARTFGAEPYYIVHAVPDMRRFAEEVVTHWTEGFGAGFKPSRREALSFIEIQNDLGGVDRDLTKRWGRKPKFAVTSARQFPFTVTYEELRAKIDGEDEPICLIFGTGYGLVDEIVQSASETKKD